MYIHIPFTVVYRYLQETACYGFNVCFNTCFKKGFIFYWISHRSAYMHVKQTKNVSSMQFISIKVENLVVVSSILQSFGFFLHVAELCCYSQVDLGNCHLTFSISSFEYRICENNITLLSVTQIISTEHKQPLRRKLKQPNIKTYYIFGFSVLMGFLFSSCLPPSNCLVFVHPRNGTLMLPHHRGLEGVWPHIATPEQKEWPLLHFLR